MKLNFKSLRAQLIMMISLVSSVGVISTILIMNANYEHSIQALREGTGELIKQEFVTLTDKHNKLLTEFGIRIQKNPEFKKVIKERNKKEIERLLNEEFHQYYVTAKVLIVNKIYAFDKDYMLLGESTEGNAFSSSSALCSQLIGAAKKREGSQRIKAINTFCYHDGHALNSVIVPVGTIVPNGYLQIVSMPTNIFKTAETKLNMPLRIDTLLGAETYQSKSWDSDDFHSIEINHSLNDINGLKAVSIGMRKNTDAIHKAFSKSRFLIVLNVTLFTLLAIGLFYYRFEKSLIRPLKTLGKKLAEAEADRKQLGQRIYPTGSPEIQDLTNKFNVFSSTLSGLYLSLENLAYRDQLTSLPNRSKLLDILNFHVSLNRRDGTPFTLVIFDLDRFKSVNDTMGHLAGDLLLQQVSSRLTTVLRKSDYFEMVSDKDKNIHSNDHISRMGGDEFAMVFPAIGDTETISVIIKKILDSLKETFLINGFKFNLGASLGVVICPNHGTDTSTLMQHADIAMYHAKDKQLDYAIYEDKLSEHSINFLSMDSELRQALKSNQLYLVYQPKIDLKTNKIISVEVLLRWDHKEQGHIAPDKFIAVAEQSGLINDITQWVVHSAFKQKSQWQLEGIDCSIAINLSANNLFYKNLIPTIKTELKKHNIAPKTVTFELTETAIMSDPEYALSVLRKLHDLGLSLSIDDFGTGYSSLAYLKRFPVNEIKIDQSFVLDMETSPNDATIVKSTIDLAHNMGMTVVAEGVETESVLLKLEKQQCDYAQGFYMAKPMKNSDFMNWLAVSGWGDWKT